MSSNESARALYHTRLAAGMCGGCGARPKVDGKTRCVVCDERRKKWYLRKRGPSVRNRADITRDPDARRRASEKYRNANREICIQRTKENYRKLKQEVLRAYGGKCECCGEAHLEFLTLDHINGDGFEHRDNLTKGSPSRFYYCVKKAGYPD